jgi:hypothetical protein
MGFLACTSSVRVCSRQSITFSGDWQAVGRVSRRLDKQKLPVQAYIGLSIALATVIVSLTNWKKEIP